jgi:hypothetical protein
MSGLVAIGCGKADHIAGMKAIGTTPDRDGFGTKDIGKITAAVTVGDAVIGSPRGI